LPAPSGYPPASALYERGQDRAATGTGSIQINLKTLEKRKIRASEIVRRLQPELEKVDGITIVDFALEAEPNHGKDSVEAIYEASLLRFRPIMMTTMAVLWGESAVALGHRYRRRITSSSWHLDGRRTAR
jgi:multidrug efflux pump subunit AcrB